MLYVCNVACWFKPVVLPNNKVPNCRIPRVVFATHFTPVYVYGRALHFWCCSSLWLWSLRTNLRTAQRYMTIASSTVECLPSTLLAPRLLSMPTVTWTLTEWNGLWEWETDGEREQWEETERENRGENKVKTVISVSFPVLPETNGWVCELLQRLGPLQEWLWACCRRPLAGVRAFYWCGLGCTAPDMCKLCSPLTVKFLLNPLLVSL